MALVSDETGPGWSRRLRAITYVTTFLFFWPIAALFAISGALSSHETARDISLGSGLAAAACQIILSILAGIYYYEGNNSAEHSAHVQHWARFTPYQLEWFRTVLGFRLMSEIEVAQGR